MEQPKKDELEIAVIYCRVSSFAQTQKGHGIDSQETRCREFARARGYAVERTFTDEAVSGGLIDRPGIREMLAYLRSKKKSAQYVVLIDDISRLARDIRAHIELRSAIASTGARLESPSIEFGEGSDAQLVEHLLASVSQHQREKNTEQVRNRMGARLTAGYWPFAAPRGYRHGQTEKGKVLVPDEPVASVLKEALEAFASGRLQTQAEMARFLIASPVFPKSHRGFITNSLVTQVLTNPVYAGYLEKTDWGISLRKGHHEGLISLETFERIRQRLSEGARAPYRSDLNADFPLRGAVVCADCGKPLTSCWSTSKTKAKHAYYMCFNKVCSQNRKSIRREKIEGDFVELLDQLAPTTTLFEAMRAMLKSGWRQRAKQVSEAGKLYRAQVAKIEKQIDTLVDCITETSVQSVLKAYENRIARLEREKLVLLEKAAPSNTLTGTFEELFELAMRFIENPRISGFPGVWRVRDWRFA